MKSGRHSLHRITVCCQELRAAVECGPAHIRALGKP